MVLLDLEVSPYDEPLKLGRCCYGDDWNGAQPPVKKEKRRETKRRYKPRDPSETDPLLG